MQICKLLSLIQVDGNAQKGGQGRTGGAHACCSPYTNAVLTYCVYRSIQVGGDPKTLHLSEQQLVSCCNSGAGFPYTDGCSGGNINDVS